MSKPKAPRTPAEELERLKWHPFYFLGLLILIFPVLLLIVDRLDSVNDIEFTRLGMYGCMGVLFGGIVLLLLFMDLRARRRRYMLLAFHEESQHAIFSNSTPVPEQYTIGDDGEIFDTKSPRKRSKKPRQR